MLFDEIEQFRRADAAVPGRVEVIPQAERETAQKRHYTLYGFRRGLAPARTLLDRIPHPLRIETPHFTPEFDPIPVEVDKGGRKFEAIEGRQFAPDFFLNIKADEKDLVTKFIFELVHDGLYLGAGNSVGRLEF